ncbi:MAG: MraY family glycosyltransferase, partial [Vulcanimicrobiota bacterium]
MPLWGGLGVSLSATIAFLVALFAVSPLTLTARQFSGVIATVFCCLFIVGVGMVDDRFGMAAKVKLMAQIGLSLILVGAGVRIDFFSLPFVDHVIYLSEWQSLFLSVLWLVGVTNAVNLLDGLDGLVAGVAC